MPTARIDPEREARNAAEHLAATDPLSRLQSRAAFLAEATAACREVGTRGALSLIIVDIDSFKAINEHYGHVVGDRAIQKVAEVVRACGLPAGRLGSDEFGILLKGLALDDGVKVAEELHRALGGLQLDTADWIVRVTCSLGVGAFRIGDSVDDLLKRADLALYRAKQEGRDRVATTPPDSWMSQRPKLGVSLARLLGTPSPDVKDRRKGAPPGDDLYARLFAIMDLLIASGLNEEIAAQIMTQRVIQAGVSAPEKIEIEEWWRHTLDRRAAFRSGKATAESVREYENVVAAIESIAPHERVECALANDLWDRRRLVAGRRPAARTLLIQ